MGAGHPPRQMRWAHCSTEFPDSPSTESWPANSADSDTSPVVSGDSSSVIGAMLMRAMRPVPVCFRAILSGGVAEPVNTNWDGSPWASSTALVTASQRTGRSCHSSSKRGRSPRRSSDGRTTAASALRAYTSGLRSFSLLSAICSHVEVLPHHFGPRTSTAGIVCNLSRSSWSARRGIYEKEDGICKRSLLWAILFDLANHRRLSVLAQVYFRFWRSLLFEFGV